MDKDEQELELEDEIFEESLKKKRKRLSRTLRFLTRTRRKTSSSRGPSTPMTLRRTSTPRFRLERSTWTKTLRETREQKPTAWCC